MPEYTVGQRVRHIASNQCGTIREIVDDWAWVQLDGWPSAVQMFLNCIAPESTEEGRA